MQYGLPGGGASWTPWEAVDLDIQGDHLIPVVWDGRLYLFWPTFTETAESSAQDAVPVPPLTSTPPPYTPNQPKKDLSITLAWSEYKQGAWSSKLTSDPMVLVDFYDTMLPIDIPPILDSVTPYFNVNAQIAKDDTLTINVNMSYGPVSGIVLTELLYNTLGQFTFSQCGKSPSWYLSNNFEALFCPQNVTLFNNALVELTDTEGVSLNVGSGLLSPPSTTPVIPGYGASYDLIGTVNVLNTTPSSYDFTSSGYGTIPSICGYDIIFPHQFFGSYGYGLLVQPPYTDQPFFYQDDQRVYFVTESFADSSANVANPSMESPFYIRATLATAPGIGSSSVVFPNAQNNRAVANKAPSAALARTKSVAASATAQPAVGASTTKVEAAPTGEQTSWPSQIQFSTFFHPHVCAFLTAVNRYGVPQLLALGTQALTNDNGILSGFVLDSPTFPNPPPSLSRRTHSAGPAV